MGRGGRGGWAEAGAFSQRVVAYFAPAGAARGWGEPLPIAETAKMSEAESVNVSRRESCIFWHSGEMSVSLPLQLFAYDSSYTKL